MEATQAMLESACVSLENPNTRRQGEELIVNFRRSQKPIAACIHIIQNSSSLDACFHASLTIRDATLREWALLSDLEKTELRRWLIQYLLSPKVNGSLNVVSKAIMGAYSTLVKRSWLEVDAQQQNGIMQELYGLVNTEGNLQHRTKGLQLLESLVTEFCPSTGSKMSMPWAFHEECRNQFEHGHLLPAFQHALTIAGVSCAPQNHPSLQAATALASTALSWPFKRGGSFISACNFGYASESSRSVQDSVSIAPGAGWRDTLLQPAAMDWLIQLLPSLGQDGGNETALAEQLRGLLVQLCSLTGDVFPGPEAIQVKRGHLVRCLTAVMQVAQPVETLIQSARTELVDGPLLDVCQCIHALSHNFLLSDLQWGLGDAQLQQYMRTVTLLTHGCITNGGTSLDLSDEWQGAGTGLLLESWTNLLQKQEHGSHEANAVASELASCTANVYQCLMDAYMSELALSATDDDGDDAAQDAAKAWEEDVMARIASLARACLSVSLPAQRDAFKQRTDLLMGATNNCSEMQKVQAFEQLWWLVQLCACTLADPGVGETPQVPHEIIHMCESEGQRETAQCAATLGRFLFDVACLSIPNQNRLKCSPRLMEAAVSALARYVDTYVAPEDELPDTCMQLGFGVEAPSILNQCLHIVAACLVHFPGEIELHKIAVTRLLSVLVSRAPRCLLVWEQPAWQELSQGFANFSGPMANLHSRYQRKLTTCICTAASKVFKSRSRDECATFMENLLGTTLRHIMSVVTAVHGSGSIQAGKVVVGRADVIDDVASALERVRGAVQGIRSASQCAVFDLLQLMLEPLARLQVVYADHTLISTLLFKLAAVLVDTQIGCLPAEKAQVLAKWCLLVLQQYRHSRDARSSGEVPVKFTIDSYTSEMTSHLRSLLTLLLNLTQRFDEDTSKTFAEVVFEGLNIMIPLLTDDALGYPKVAQTYYRLILQLCETHASEIGRLPESHFTPLVRSLDWGLVSPDTSIASQCYGALGELASFHFTDVQAGRPGLSGHLLADGSTVLVHYMRIIVSQLLSDSSPQAMMEQAADALLPMILSEHASFVQSGIQLLSQAEENVRVALQSQLELLLQGVDSQSLDRAGRSQFKTQLQSFVANARGLLHSK